jgi:predicted GIY-YIG superfamily endonuclease
MAVPSIVFIVANDKRETLASYTKDLELALDLIARGTYDDAMTERGLSRLVYREEQPTVREAIARVAQINSMSPAARRKLVEKLNPRWVSVGPADPFPPKSRMSRLQPEPQHVYVVGSLNRKIEIGYGSDLTAAILSAQARWAKRGGLPEEMPRLVYLTFCQGEEKAKQWCRKLQRMGKERVRQIVDRTNPTWNDLRPSKVPVPAGRMTFRERPDDPPSAGGGVGARLPLGPRAPVGTRTGEYEEPRPPVEE